MKENSESVPHLEIIELVLVHCNIVNQDYQQDSRVLYTFISNKSFGQLLDISPQYFIFIKYFRIFIQLKHVILIKILNR